MSEHDRQKWNARYAGPVYRMGATPNAWLNAIATQLPCQGQALDIAAGEGQNAVFLARRGLQTTALDISEAGLKKAKTLAEASGVSLQLKQVDLDDAHAHFPTNHYDLITIFHFLDRRLIACIAQALKVGGLVALEIMGQKNLERHAHPSARFLLEAREITQWFPHFKCHYYYEGWRAGRYVCQFIAEK